MKKMCVFYALLLVFCICLTTHANTENQEVPSIVGKWKTIDDKTKQPKSIVEIYEKDGQYSGRVIQLFRQPGEDPNPLCDKCPDDDPRKNQPTIGMVIINNMVKTGDNYSGGTILDPKDGKIYRCKLWMENDNLMVRGYVAFLFRTQTWLRAE